MDTVESVNKFGLRKDYLNFSTRENIKNDFERLQEKPLPLEILTDSVFIYDSTFKKKRSAIIITQEKIYLYDLAKWRLLFRTELQSLKAVSITTKNCTLACLHFNLNNRDVDIIIESYRRVELVVYLARMFRDLKDPKNPLFKLKMRENFEFRQVARDGDRSVMTEEEKALEKIQKGFEAPYLSETIRNAKKTGFMRLAKKGGFFAKVSLEEYYFLLSDMGLVYFKKYGVSRVAYLEQEVAWVHPAAGWGSEAHPEIELREGLHVFGQVCYGGLLSAVLFAA
jgi:Unconventional myosin tail, actin- and lipid-binding